MMIRYINIKFHIEKLDDDDFNNNFPTASEYIQVEYLLKVMRDLHFIQFKLHDDENTTAYWRNNSDKRILIHPVCKKY